MADAKTARMDAGAQDESQRIAGMNPHQKLAAITGELGPIAKGGTNSEQKYKFIEYAAVAGALRELFAKYRVLVIPNMGDRTENEITSQYGKAGYRIVIMFTFEFVNADKTDDKFTIKWDGEAIDYGDKAINKAATAALKYCLMRTFNVSEKGDEDPDSVSHDIETPPPTKKLTKQDALAKASALLLHKGVEDAEMRKTIVRTIAGVKSLNELTATQLNYTLEVIESHNGQQLAAYLDADVVEEVPDDPAAIDDMVAEAADKAQEAAA